MRSTVAIGGLEAVVDGRRRCRAGRTENGGKQDIKRRHHDRGGVVDHSGFRHLRKRVPETTDCCSRCQPRAASRKTSYSACVQAVIPNPRVTYNPLNARPASVRNTNDGTSSGSPYTPM